MSSSTLSVYSSLFVATVWSGHPVGFDLLTHGDMQFIAFYNAERKMTVGMRKIDEEIWTFAHPEVYGWRTEADCHRRSDGTVTIH